MPTNNNLYALLETAFVAAGDKPAFIEPERQNLSYHELSDRVAQMAAALQGLGVTPGARVMVQVDKSINAVCLYLATLKLGAVYNPLNSAYTAHELDYFIQDAGPALLVTTAGRLTELEPLAKQHGVKTLTTLEADGSGALARLAFEAPRPQNEIPPTHHCKTRDLAALVYTSGTTGRSKGAMISHDNLISNGQVLRDYWGITRDDVLLHALPIFHVHGLFVALHTALLAGASIRWLPKFDVDALLAALPGSTVMMGVPTFYTRLLAHADFTPASCKQMRLFISGSAPLLSDTHIEFERRSAHVILERYGMSETGMITSNPYRREDGLRRAGTVGFAIPGSAVRIADDDGTILPHGEIGVLETKGPNVFAGYWKQPDKTAQEFREDGFFITGDLAQQDKDGRVTIVGRARDLIISGGFNIYPKEIEDELNTLPGISDSAVIGVPHPDFGEGVVAVIVPGEDGAPLQDPNIIAELAAKLAKFKLPKRIVRLDCLPRNTMGKVQKNELRRIYADSFSS